MANQAKKKPRQPPRIVRFEVAAPSASTVERTVHHRDISIGSRGHILDHNAGSVVLRWQVPDDWAAQNNWELGLDDAGTSWDEPQPTPEPALEPTSAAKRKRKRSQSAVWGFTLAQLEVLV